MRLAAAATTAAGATALAARRLAPKKAPRSDAWSDQTQQFFDRLFTTPTPERAALYAGAIDSLSAAGIWGMLDCLYVLAGSDQLTALTNLVSDQYRATWPVQLGPFAADRGTTSLGTATYLDTGFNPARAARFQQNSACLFAWNLSTVPQPGYMLGRMESHIAPYDDAASNHTLWGINSQSEVDSGAIAADASGLWLANRTSGTSSNISRNGAQLAASSLPSVTPSNSTIAAVSNDTCQLAVIGAGAGLTDGQGAYLYSALQGYLQGVGAL